MFDRVNEVVFQVTRLDVLLWVLGFFVLINIISIVATYADKQLAINNKRRISEKALFIIAFLGGAISQYFVMNFIRHKTLHKKFMIGLPLIFSAQIGLFIWWLAVWF